MVGGSPRQKAYQNEKLYFQNPVPFSNMKFSEHKFDRLDEIFCPETNQSVN